MDTSRFGQFVVCFMFLSSIGQALRCQKGVQNQGDPLLDRILQCPSSSAVCGRADFEFVPGSRLSSSFDCVERASCMPKNCASFAGFDGVSLSKCEFKCCDNDLCNNQTLRNISHVEPLTTVPMPPIPETTTTSDSPRTTTTDMVEPPTSGIDAETATGTNVPILRPPGMLCLQGMKLPLRDPSTEPLACISETQVCARVDFVITNYFVVMSFFKCVERNNCTQSKCEEHINMNGVTASMCDFKCCSSDMCNNNTLSDITGINMDSTSTKKAEMPDRKTNLATAPEKTQVTTKSSPATASLATTASLPNIQTTSGVCTSTTFSSTLMVAAVFGAIVAANFVQ